VACIVQGALVGGLLEEQLGVVSCGFGLCERGGEGFEGRVVQDLFRVLGHGPSDDVDVPVDRLLGRSALGEGGQWFGCGLVVGGLEVDKGLVGGGDLLVVVAELVPAGCGDDDEDRGVEKHRQGRAVCIGNVLPEHPTYSAA
jgi:hypothetical protein